MCALVRNIAPFGVLHCHSGRQHLEGPGNRRIRMGTPELSSLRQVHHWRPKSVKPRLNQGLSKKNE